MHQSSSLPRSTNRLLLSLTLTLRFHQRSFHPSCLNPFSLSSQDLSRWHSQETDLGIRESINKEPPIESRLDFLVDDSLHDWIERLIARPQPRELLLEILQPSSISKFSAVALSQLTLVVVTNMTVNGKHKMNQFYNFFWLDINCTTDELTECLLIINHWGKKKKTVEPCIL